MYYIQEVICKNNDVNITVISQGFETKEKAKRVIRNFKNTIQIYYKIIFKPIDKYNNSKTTQLRR
jgi:hypothetical protein